MTQLPKRSYLVVDGHSIIHAWDELRALHGRLPYRAREELVRRLTAYADVSEDFVVLVFDGKGDRVAVELEKKGIQVIYADRSHTADDIIERLVANYAGLHVLTVATNDLAEQMTVAAFGGFSISADGLREKLDRAAADLRRIRRF